MPDASDSPGRSEVVVNREGRILIPAQVRRELGIGSGSTLVLYVEDGRVVMESQEDLLNRIRREVAASWQGTPGVSAADELIAERRAEAAAEDTGPDPLPNTAS